jgi:thiamine-monophosphate kinase
MPKRGKRLSEFTEDQLIARLTRKLPATKGVHIGVGDDCAVIGGPRDKTWQLLKTDAVIEGIHFGESEDWRRVGWKALCRNISDIAAMGGEPAHALVTLAVAPEVEMQRVEALYTGLGKAARRFGVGIVGGETSRSPGPLFVSVALTGTVEQKRLATRSGGRQGDTIFVTGRLGGSLSSGKHLDFVPRLAEARWLTSEFAISAMMDISDGVGSDLPRLAAASGCGFDLNLDTIPRTKGCTVEQALADGEDFELLFSVPSKDSLRLTAAWKKQFPRLPLTRIGELTAHSKEGTPSTIQTRGFDHFALPR